MKTLYIFFSILLTIIAFEACSSKAEVSPEPKITLLMTHPKPKEIKNIVFLKKQGMFQLSGLRVVGLIHENEWEDYKDSYKYLKKHHPEWIELKKISCNINEKQIFQTNPCSPIYKQLFEGSSGILFTGGPDIPPFLYGKKTSLTTVIRNTPRHIFEISFLAHLLGGLKETEAKAFLSERPAYTVVGICMGMQSINVAMGGSLIQDIPSEIYGITNHENGMRQNPDAIHRSHEAALFPSPEIGKMTIHAIRLIKQPTPEALWLENHHTPKVISLHHQAVERLGDQLKVFATSTDEKIIEGLRHKLYANVLGVQFHPEKRELWSPWMNVRTNKKGFTAKNFVTEWLIKDKLSQSFHKNFWKLAAKMLMESQKNHPEKPNSLLDNPENNSKS